MIIDEKFKKVNLFRSCSSQIVPKDQTKESKPHGSSARLLAHLQGLQLWLGGTESGKESQQKNINMHTG